MDQIQSKHIQTNKHKGFAGIPDTSRGDQKDTGYIEENVAVSAFFTIDIIRLRIIMTANMIVITGRLTSEFGTARISMTDTRQTPA